MATITIENVPENIVKLYGTKIIYDEIQTSFLPKKRVTNRLKGLSKEEMEEKFYDKKDESYGPFVGEEAVTFLNSRIK